MKTIGRYWIVCWLVAAGGLLNGSDVLAEERDGAESYRLRRAAADCKQMPYTKQCESFWENEFGKNKSEEFCKQHPDDEGCGRWRTVQETRQRHLVRLEAAKELSAYCQENPDAQRCSTRKTRVRGQTRGQ